MIRINEPRLGPEVEAAVLSVLRSGHIAQGPVVERFEGLCGAMAGTEHAVAVANGSVALEASLRALGIGPGDEIITSPLTFAATLNAILAVGATARFADVRDDHTVDPGSVASLIRPATSALLPVHLYGLPAEMGPIVALAEANGVAVVEDAAQAHGASAGGRPAGSFGLGCFSFYATKNVTSGEGGVITTSDAELARRLRVIRNQGMSEQYRYEMVGRNLRLTDLQAAVAVPQLESLDAIIEARRHNASTLVGLLRDRAPQVGLPFVPAGRTHVWHQFTVLLPDGVDRASLVDRMGSVGVQAGVYYPSLVWDHPPYLSHPQVVRDHTPVAAVTAARCLSLPVHPGLSEDDLEVVAGALTTALASATG